jgi:uncharacterized protein
MQREKSKALPKSSPPKSKPKPSLKRIKRLLHEHLPSLRNEYGLGALWLFGSFVQGEQHKCSDLDVLVEFTEVPTLPKFIALEIDLSNITGIKVDLFSIRSLKGDIGKRILRERVPV